MTRSLAALAATALITAVALPAQAGGRHRHDRHDGVSISIDDGRAPKSCDDLRVRFDRRPAARAQETVNLSSGATVRLAPGENGGVHVWGSARRDVSVTVCKFAYDDGDSARILAGISARPSGSELAVSGPSGERWTAYLLVEAPQGSSLDVETENGPVGARDFDGTLELKAENGPVSLRNVSGTVTARAENGPIEVDGGSGALDLETTNGPVDVDLRGTRWDGKGLRAVTTNGPISLRLPDGFASAVRVDASRWSPVDCDAPACDRGQRRKSEDERTILFGEGEPLVRLSTTNGPVTIR